MGISQHHCLRLTAATSLLDHGPDPGHNRVDASRNTHVAGFSLLSVSNIPSPELGTGKGRASDRLRGLHQLTQPPSLPSGSSQSKEKGSELVKVFGS